MIYNYLLATSLNTMCELYQKRFIKAFAPILIITTEVAMMNQWVREINKFTQNFYIRMVERSKV
jgi:hypothetical protein